MEISVVNSRTSIRTLLEVVSFDRKHIDRGVIASPGFLGVQEDDETKFTSREWSRLGSSVLIVGRFLVFRVRRGSVLLMNLATDQLTLCTRMSPRYVSLFIVINTYICILLLQCFLLVCVYM